MVMASSGDRQYKCTVYRHGSEAWRCGVNPAQNKSGLVSKKVGDCHSSFAVFKSRMPHATTVRTYSHTVFEGACHADDDGLGEACEVNIS